MTDVLQHWQDTTLILPRRLCLADCEAIDWQEIDFPAQSVCIDAAHVEAIDSIGIAALVLLLRKARTQQVSIEWLNLGQPLHNMLAVYELDNGVFLSCRNN